MTNKTQNILILVITLLVLGVVILWFFVLNRGTVAVTAGLSDYSITINNITTSCPADPCLAKVKIGTYELKFEKEGYNPVSAKVDIARWKTSAVTLQPKKKVEIVPSAIIPKTEAANPAIPADLNADNIISPVWSADGRLLFLDRSDERLKIRNTDGKIKLVTVLKQITPPINFYWSADSARIIGSQKGDLYFMDVDQGSRKKQVLEFAPSDIVWSPKSDFILVDDGSGAVYKIDWENRENPKKLEADPRLSQSEWIDDSTLLVYSIDTENNKTTIWTYNPSSEIREDLVEKFDFVIDKMVYDKEAQKAYLRNPRESGWYEISLL